jgi:DNA/RNA-binding domain of Phe-tRNA-synthetase-like protein
VGIDPKNYKPALEAIVRRTTHGDDLSLDQGAIDAGTILTLTHLIPVGMHCIDEMSGELRLTRSSGSETFTKFDGESENPDTGEVVYCSGTRVLTRRWVWRQGQSGSVSKTSRAFAINLDLIDAASPVPRIDQVNEQLDMAGITVDTVFTLDAATPHWSPK